MTYPLTNYSRVWVRGRFIDIRKAVNQETNYGLAGTVTFVPSPEALLDADLKMILGVQRFTATPAAADGYFAVQLPATDDPQINPFGWTYEVTEPTGRTYSIVVPYDTPTLVASGDPLNGQQVIELSNVVPNPEPNPGTAQLLVGQTGRGITSMAINGSNQLIATYTDGATQNLGGVTYTPAAHVHAAADVSSGTLAVARIPTGTTSTTVSLGNHTHTDTPATLTDGATVALNAALGKVFKLTVASGAASSTHTISVPTNPADGKGIILAFRNESANPQTLALTTGTTGSFRFSATITALSTTAAGKTDYVGAIYSSDASRWDVVSYVKGA